MRILKLKLRGAIGIRKGLGVDEIEIDFQNFEPGLIALTGRNGSGKTTIMENLHPYRQMVSRDGSLQSHFFLKDSYRILDFELNGSKYQSKILIDALTGGSEAYLFEDDKPLNDGKLTTYDEAIENLLGSPELFFNSVFSGQKSKGIAELKPADRRKLFYELLNLNSYEAYLEQAKRELRDQEFKLAKIEGELSGIGELDFTEEGLEKERTKNLAEGQSVINELNQIDNNIEAANEAIQEFEISIRTCEESLKENQSIELRIKELTSEIDKVEKEHHAKVLRYESDMQDYQKIMEGNELCLNRKEEIESAIVKMEQLEQELTELKDTRAALLEKNGEIQKKYSEKREYLNGKQKEIDKLLRELDSFEHEIQSVEKEIEHHRNQTSLISEVPCDQETGSKCMFLMNAFESKGLIAQCEDRKKNLTDSHSDLKTMIEKRSIELSQDEHEVEEWLTNAKMGLGSFSEIDEQLYSVDANLSTLLKQNFKEQLKNLQSAEHNLELYEQKYDSTFHLLKDSKLQYDREIYRLRNERSLLEEKIDKELPVKINNLRERLSKQRLELQNLKTKHSIRTGLIDELKADLLRIDQNIKTLKETKVRLAALNDDKKKVENEIRDWTFLCKAFDKTGIPVLKLENSGIEITSIANELLSLFENKFRIVFETTSLTKDKKKTKETFDINIVEEDGVTELANKSGGERVWIETALQLAISLIVREQGKKIETSFLDEKDGALDLNNAGIYLQMLQSAHKRSGVHNTFIITHRPELIDLIPQRVSLVDGYLQILNNN